MNKKRFGIFSPCVCEVFCNPEITYLDSVVRHQKDILGLQITVYHLQNK